MVTFPYFRLPFELLFFTAFGGICNPAFGLVFNLSKKVSKPCLPARQERTPPHLPRIGVGLRPGGGGFPCLRLGFQPDLAFALLWLQIQ
jgi:hypothetical protein